MIYKCISNFLLKIHQEVFYLFTTIVSRHSNWNKYQDKGSVHFMQRIITPFNYFFQIISTSYGYLSNCVIICYTNSWCSSGYTVCTNISKNCQKYFYLKGRKAVTLQSGILLNEELHNEHTSPSTAVVAAITDKTWSADTRNVHRNLVWECLGNLRLWEMRIILRCVYTDIVWGWRLGRVDETDSGSCWVVGCY